MKKEFLDLYFVLKKRNVSLEEWLKFHELNSVEEFMQKADEIAGRIDCMISDRMRTDALELLKSKEVVEDSNLTDDSVQVLDTKKKTKNKKQSSNDSSNVVKLDTSESLMKETSSKEKSNENSE